MRRNIFSCLLALSIILSALNIPIHTPFTKNIGVESTTGQTIPVRYDLREKGLVTSVKSDNGYSTGWAFAACASMESNALVLGLGTYDLSEYYLTYWAMNIPANSDESIKGEGFKANKPWYDTPGNYRDAAALLMKGFGPVTEDRAPYSNIKSALPEDSINWPRALSIYACNTITAEKTKTIKEAILNNGAIALSVCASSWDDTKYTNLNTGAAYLPEWNDTYKHVDHAVTIIGWDDDYSKENFPIRPEGNGAWIIKNCWGKEAGDHGYYYLSYYDVSLNKNNTLCQFLVSPASQTDDRYQYDGGCGLWYDDATSGVGIAFTVKEDQTITGVRINPLAGADGSFAPLKAQIKVYTDVSDNTKIEAGVLIYSQYEDILFPGYQLIEFDKGVNIRKAQKIWVVVKFDRPIFYALDSDTELSTGKVIAPAHTGETFITRGGSEWSDYTALYNDKSFNVCMKVDVRNGLDQAVIHRIPKEDTPDDPDDPDVPDDPVVTLGETTFYLLNNEEAKITVTWKEVIGAEGYYVYRRIEGKEADFTLLAAVYNSTKYHDIGLKLGTDYTYKVIPFAGSAIGTSPEKTIRATIAAPWIMSLTNKSAGQVRVAYSRVIGAKSYSVYRAKAGGTYSFIGNTKNTYFIDKHAKRGTTYSYKLSVKKGNRQSALSAAKTIKVKK